MRTINLIIGFLALVLLLVIIPGTAVGLVSVWALLGCIVGFALCVVLARRYDKSHLKNDPVRLGTELYNDGWRCGGDIKPDKSRILFKGDTYRLVGFATWMQIEFLCEKAKRESKSAVTEDERAW